MACLICGSPAAANRRYCAQCTAQAVQGMGPISAVESPPTPPPLFAGPPPIPERDGIPSLDPYAVEDRSSDFPLGTVLIAALLIAAAGYGGALWWEPGRHDPYHVGYHIGMAVIPLLAAALVALFPWRSRGKAFVIAAVIFAGLSMASQWSMSHLGPDHQDRLRAEREVIDDATSASTVLPPPLPALAADSSDDARAAHLLRELMMDRRLFRRRVAANNQHMHGFQLDRLLLADQLVSASTITANRATLREYLALIGDNRSALDQFLGQAHGLAEQLAPLLGPEFKHGFDKSEQEQSALLAEFFQNEQALGEHAGQMLDMAEQNLGRWHVQGDHLIVGHGQLTAVNRLSMAILANARIESQLQASIKAMSARQVAQSRHIEGSSF